MLTHDLNVTAGRPHTPSGIPVPGGPVIDGVYKLEDDSGFYLTAANDYLAFETAETALWTPTRISTVGWWDASDTSTITHSSNAVSQWSDKSGNNYHASQSTADKQPMVATNSIGGKTAIEFDGSDSMGASTRLGLGANPAISVFAVVNDRTNVADGRIFHLGGSSLSLSCGTGSDGWAWRFDGGNEMYSIFPSQSFDYPNLVVWQRTADSNIADSKFYFNGAEQASSGSNNPTGFPTNTTEKFVIGANSGAFGNFFDGSIGEIIVIESDSNSDRQKIEGYLAHKWGIDGNLDSLHPYALGAPTI